MYATVARWRWAAAAVAAGLVFCLWGGRLAAAGDPAAEARIQAHLEAGEFAPAVVLAQDARDPGRRDALLGQVAMAQAQAGARDAAVRSVAQIGDDRARARILAQVASQPLGGRWNPADGAAAAANAPGGAFGGGNQADFDDLIDLITNTVAPKSWDANGGQGTIAPFPTGVWVDAQGVLRPLLKEAVTGDLAALRAARARRGSQDDVRRRSPLRMVSLVRLEKQVQLGLAAGRQPDEAMQMLAGLRRIRYVFVYPESRDLVLAGPAGDWTVGPEGRILAPDSGAPVLRLEDLVVVLRHMLGGPDAKFGCLITPRQEALARAEKFVSDWSHRAVKPEARKAWLEQFRSQVGKQDIEVYGLDPRTRAARTLVEADYRMKLVGMGLEEGVPGVVSYLNLIQQKPPPMGVLRWWFTLDYDAVLTAKDRLAFELRGQGVKVESENEHLTAQGQRVHTGESEPLNRKFAQSFTEHFDALCRKYPIYADLRNLCDLALASALLREEGIPERIGWHATCFGDPRGYPVELSEAPKEVDTVANCRVINRTTFVAGVSGGVKVEPAGLVRRQAIEVENYPRLQADRPAAAPKPAAADRWWWD
ncbi:MAG: DUF1598 domain-containing protein [Thermoguttaceae bacterium]